MPTSDRWCLLGVSEDRYGDQDDITASLSGQQSPGCAGCHAPIMTCDHVKRTRILSMICFDSVAELAAFLGKLNPDYAQHAPALWQKGARTPRQLANCSEPLHLACGVPEGHVDDIKATAGGAGVTGPPSAVDCVGAFKAKLELHGIYRPSAAAISRLTLHFPQQMLKAQASSDDAMLLYKQALAQPGSQTTLRMLIDLHIAVSEQKQAAQSERLAIQTLGLDKHKKGSALVECSLAWYPGTMMGQQADAKYDWGLLVVLTAVE
ncbi:hypothetical protein WJX82_005089 [Trebouxia sp. C0006]